ncbi:MAG: hypothetical protein FWB72_06885 [Firmicutes bacterium]|nr:hypothetical protein [Bacillota bacterium]
MGLISWMLGKSAKGRRQKAAPGKDSISSDKYEAIKGYKFGKLDELSDYEKRLVALGAVIESESAKDRRLHVMDRNGGTFRDGTTAREVIDKREAKRAERRAKWEANNKGN